MSKTSHQEVSMLVSQLSSASSHSPQRSPLKAQKPHVWSQNHRMGQAGRDHSGPFGSISLLRFYSQSTQCRIGFRWFLNISTEYSQSYRELCTETHLGATGCDCLSESYVPCICNGFFLSARLLNEKSPSPASAISHFVFRCP